MQSHSSSQSLLVPLWKLLLQRALLALQTFPLSDPKPDSNQKRISKIIDWSDGALFVIFSKLKPFQLNPESSMFCLGAMQPTNPGCFAKAVGYEKTKQSWTTTTTKKRRQQQKKRWEEGGESPQGWCDSLSLHNTNQATQILIFTVINFIQTSSRLSGFVWEFFWQFNVSWKWLGTSWRKKEKQRKINGMPNVYSR